MTDRTGTDVAPSVRVVEAVAEYEGVDPTELPSLQDAIDGDALDALFRGRRGPESRVAFSYAGKRVVVGADGHVKVEAITR